MAQIQARLLIRLRRIVGSNPTSGANRNFLTMDDLQRRRLVDAFRDTSETSIRAKSTAFIKKMELTRDRPVL